MSSGRPLQILGDAERIGKRQTSNETYTSSYTEKLLTKFNYG